MSAGVDGSSRTRVELGRREDLGADCANCFGLCCVALAFSRSSDFPVDKPAGEPCGNLDTEDACTIHRRLRPEGFVGCTVFDCFGTGQKVSTQTFGGVSWREDATVRERMFAVFPLMRRLHELLWYLDVALGLPGGDEILRAALKDRFDAVHAETLGEADRIIALDVDAEYASARPLLIAASAAARARATPGGPTAQRPTAPRLAPGADLVAARLRGADLRGADLRGALLIASDLRGADLRACDLLGVDLRDADVSGADLSEAIYLTQAQINSARGDASTALPPSFERPSHWGREQAGAEAAVVRTPGPRRPGRRPR